MEEKARLCQAFISMFHGMSYETCLIIYPAMIAFTDQYSLPNIVFDIGQL
jgi:hypothetical protein